MSWAKLDDGFWMHPKVVRAGNEGAGIFCRCLSYCGAYLTDGLIPEPVALSIAGSKTKLEAVIDAGLLERVSTLEGAGVWIRDYADFNPLRAEVDAKREQRREAGRRGGVAPRRPRAAT
jgi:hypothetical protein